MPNQEQSKHGRPEKDAGRPSPDVEKDAVDGQADPRTGGAGPGAKDYRGDGPGKVGLTSDQQRDLVAPSGVNERDHGAADDKPMGGGALNFDDESEERPRGDTSRSGGTWDAQGGDAGSVDKAPGAGLSNSNGPSDRSR